MHPLPDPNNGLNDGDRKVYTTLVKLDNGSASLRPGMTATVDIIVADLDHALTVPRETVVQYDRERMSP